MRITREPWFESAHPGVVLDAIVGRTPRLPLGQLAEVVAETISAAAVVAHPEGWFADDDAARAGHGGEVVGRVRGDVDMGVDVLHG